MTQGFGWTQPRGYLTGSIHNLQTRTGRGEAPRQAGNLTFEAGTGAKQTQRETRLL